jgi:hypothetical protein
MKQSMAVIEIKMRDKYVPSGGGEKCQSSSHNVRSCREEINIEGRSSEGE